MSIKDHEIRTYRSIWCFLSFLTQFHADMVMRDCYHTCCSCKTCVIIRSDSILRSLFDYKNHFFVGLGSPVHFSFECYFSCHGTWKTWKGGVGYISFISIAQLNQNVRTFPCMYKLLYPIRSLSINHKSFAFFGWYFFCASVGSLVKWIVECFRLNLTGLGRNCCHKCFDFILHYCFFVFWRFKYHR